MAIRKQCAHYDLSQQVPPILLGTLLAATTTIMGQTVSVANVTPDATDVTLRVLQFNMCNNFVTVEARTWAGLQGRASGS